MSIDHIVMGAASGGAGAGDPNWSSVTLLLKFDGAAGSTTFTDLSSVPITVTATGNPVISSTQVKYGTGSVYINGGTSSNTHYLGTSNVASVQLGTTYTIEGWFWTANTANQRYFGKYTAGVGGWLLLCTNTNITWYFAGDGASNISASVTVPMSSWNHIAISATPAVSNLYLNGVQVGTFANPPAPQNDANGFRIGTYIGSVGSDFTGYVDDFRITKGVARYTSNFTPPSTMLTLVADTSVTTYVDDVFSTYLYTGNGAANTITTGVNLLTAGGLIWTKNRGSATDHWFTYSNSAHIANFWSYIDVLHPNTTNTRWYSGSAIDEFTTTGFHIAGGACDVNYTNANYASWSFRKATKFFDIVMWTGDGTGTAKTHNLGIVPGMLIVKATSTDTFTDANDWMTWHNGMASGSFVNSPAGGSWPCAAKLNSTAGQGVYGGWCSVSSSTFNPTYHNTAGVTYIAFLFAHDTSSTSMIKCGSFTTDASGNGTFQDIGFEPQWVMVKCISSAEEWVINDSMRGMFANPASSAYALKPNLTDAESLYGVGVNLNATGFTGFGSGSKTYIYMAIRRPNKPPTLGTQVYKGVLHPSSGAMQFSAGFPPDLVISMTRSAGAYPNNWYNRLRGIGNPPTGAAMPYLTSTSTAAEANTGPYFYMGQDGFAVNVGWSDTDVIQMFKRAPGFFDVVCYTGDSVGSYNSWRNHNLGIVPEFIIVKGRSAATDWHTWAGDGLGNVHPLYLNSNLAEAAYGKQPVASYATSSQINVGNLGVYYSNQVNATTSTYVAYLFATLAGISKVGSYTGNGNSLTINCGFASGARFVLIKRTDAASDWYVGDTARGIVNLSADPKLKLNSTAVENVLDDWIDPASVGFTAKHSGNVESICILNATYTYLAIS